jgi:hypothetical protein
MIDAAILWGDYLFGKNDYRGAADAYGMATDATDAAKTHIAGTRKDPSWAKYQRANALLALNDYDASLALFQQIAGSGSPWAKEAGMKAEYARLQQRMRGTAPAVAAGGPPDSGAAG